MKRVLLSGAWGVWGAGAALAACAQLLAFSPVLAAPSAPAAAKNEASSAQVLLAQVRQRVQDAPVVRGQFTQLKTVQGFKQPLKSSGDFVVARGKGIAWQVRQPFASTLIVKPDSLLYRLKPQKPFPKRRILQQPAIAMMLKNQLLLPKPNR